MALLSVIVMLERQHLLGNDNDLATPVMNASRKGMRQIAWVGKSAVL